MPELHGRAYWPGVNQVYSCTYTASHGTMPGTACLTIYPQTRLPDQFGNLTITDGGGLVIIPGCRLDQIKYQGGRWVLTISDPRWRWRDGLISGTYNQRDPRGLLLPWSLKTVPQLIALCFQAMNFDGYTTDLPNLGTEAGDVFPAVDWDAVNPAQALTGLLERLGCRIAPVFGPTDSFLVRVVQLGVGKELPSAGSFKQKGPTLNNAERPDSYMLAGAPIRYQSRFVLMAVGEEVDGSLRPIEYLSYAPDPVGTPHTFKITPEQIEIGDQFTIEIFGPTGDDPVATFTVTSTDGTATEIVTLLLAAISANVQVTNIFNLGITPTASDGGTTLTLTGPTGGPQEGQQFGVVTDSTGGSFLGSELEQVGQPPDVRWKNPPPYYGNLKAVGAQGVIKATDALSFLQAAALANKTVYRYYRVINLDPAGRLTGLTRPLNVPGYGEIKRVEQLLLQDSQVEQLVPQDADPNILGPDDQPLDRPLYDGWSRDKPAQIFGSWSPYYANIVHPASAPGAKDIFDADGNVKAQGSNTAIDEEVRGVDFSIDANRQLVIFSRPVYRWESKGFVQGKGKFGVVVDGASLGVGAFGGRCAPAILTLQTACQIRDATNNQVIRYSRVFVPDNAASQGGVPVLVHREEVVNNYIGQYNQITNQLTGTLTDEPFARALADYYLQAEAAKHAPSEGAENVYNGILPIQLDGAILQVTWSIGGGQAPQTTASRNTEHSLYIPTYAERLRFAFLPPGHLAEQVGRKLAPLPEPKLEGHVGRPT